jgi:hypothetical protein
VALIVDTVTGAVKVVVAVATVVTGKKIERLSGVGAGVDVGVGDGVELGDGDGVGVRVGEGVDVGEEHAHEQFPAGKHPGGHGDGAQVAVGAGLGLGVGVGPVGTLNA